MVRTALAALLIINTTFATAEPLSFDIRCFSSEGKNNINVLFATTYIADGRLNIGYVRYEKSDTSIPIFFSGETEKILDMDRPSEARAIWKEIINSNINGEYTITSQGANIYSFRYKNKSGKITNFKYNPIATKPDYSGCNWK